MRMLLHVLSKLDAILELLNRILEQGKTNMASAQDLLTAVAALQTTATSIEALLGSQNQTQTANQAAIDQSVAAVEATTASLNSALQAAQAAASAPPASSTSTAAAPSATPAKTAASV